MKVCFLALAITMGATLGRAVTIQLPEFRGEPSLDEAVAFEPLPLFTALQGVYDVYAGGAMAVRGSPSIPSGAAKNVALPSAYVLADTTLDPTLSPYYDLMSGQSGLPGYSTVLITSQPTISTPSTSDLGYQPSYGTPGLGGYGPEPAIGADNLKAWGYQPYRPSGE